MHKFRGNISMFIKLATFDVGYETTHGNYKIIRSQGLGFATEYINITLILNFSFKRVFFFFYVFVYLFW